MLQTGVSPVWSLHTFKEMFRTNSKPETPLLHLDSDMELLDQTIFFLLESFIERKKGEMWTDCFKSKPKLHILLNYLSSSTAAGMSSQAGLNRLYIYKYNIKCLEATVVVLWY